MALRVNEADWDLVPMTGWGALAVFFVVLILSWIGYHRNRQDVEVMTARRRVGSFTFYELRFVQYVIEIAILGVYFALGHRVDLPDRARPAPAPSAYWTVSCVVIVFILYAAWDGLDVLFARRHEKELKKKDTSYGHVHTLVKQAKRGAWAHRAKGGGAVTLAFLAVFALLLVGVATRDPRTTTAVVGVDIVLVVFLYLYRVVQEVVRGYA